MSGETMPSPRTLSASSTPPPADCNPQTVVLEGDLDKSGEATVPNETGKGDEDDASSCLSSEFDPADEMDPDFYYGPKPVDDATAISEDEMSLQVAIALQHLERLQMLSGDPQLKALFVRWTIHNWATQGPFNIHAYKETLEEFFAARNCSEEAISGDDAGETFETTIAKFEGGCADQTQEGAHVAQDAAMAPAAASRDQVEEALDVELGPRMESKVGSWGAWPEDEAKSALVRRVRCKGRWSRPLAAHDGARGSVYFYIYQNADILLLALQSSFHVEVLQAFSQRALPVRRLRALATDAAGFPPSPYPLMTPKRG